MKEEVVTGFKRKEYLEKSQYRDIKELFMGVRSPCEFGGGVINLWCYPSVRLGNVLK